MKQDVFYLATPQQLPLNPQKLISSHNSRFIEDHIDHFLTALHQQSRQEMRAYGRLIFSKIASTKSNFCALSDDRLASKENTDNDVAFDIVRVSGNIMELLCFSAIKAYLYLLDDIEQHGTSITADEWGMISRAYLTLLGLYTSPSQLTLPRKGSPWLPSDKPVSISTGDEAHERWVHGHYIFMTLTQGMIVALNFFENAIQESQLYSGSYYLDVASVLMETSSVALKYAGDFSEDAYLEGVRPTLMPPQAQPKMSGLYWRDHEFLIKHNFKALGSIFSDPPSAVIPQVKAFKRAIEAAYNSHHFVCKQFVGDKEASLLSTKPAIDVIESFKHSRFKTIIIRGKL